MPSILAIGVKIIDQVGGGLKLKSKVTVRNFLTDVGVADPVYKDIKYTAFVDKSQKRVRTSTGEERMATTIVTFAKPNNIVKEHDIITLQDGSGGPVISVDGYIDGPTGQQVVTEAYLG